MDGAGDGRNGEYVHGEDGRRDLEDLSMANTRRVGIHLKQKKTL